MKQIKVWPHMTIVAVLCAIIAAAGVALYFKHQQTVQAEALPNAARIQRLDGQVAFSDGLNPGVQNNDNSRTNEEWIAATPNQSFSVGDRLYTRENSHASLAFTGRNFARLNPNTELDMLQFSDDRTQLALRDGSAIFDIGNLTNGDLFEVATPCGAVDFEQAGLYNVGFDDSGSVLVSALNGTAQVVGLGGSGRINKGEMLPLTCQKTAPVSLSRLDHRNAGYVVDDYYRYEYPNVYDGRYNDYDAYLSDPDYYDPYRRDVSYQYASSYIPGLNDLDYYGDWQDVSGYGHCWRPRVDAGWAPYQQGYWANDYPYGPTWVSSEPWGYAPYHYGRWVNAGQWLWIPDGVHTTPRYAPALVAFVPLTDANEIGWVPLGPGDPYVARYYDRNWKPYYLTRADIHPRRFINLDVPGAVTVIQVNDFGRDIDRRIVHRIDRQRLAQARPVLDPLTLTPLRNAVMHSAWGRGKVDLPPGIAKKLNDRPVLVAAAPPAPPFRKDLARALHVQSLPDVVKSQRLNLKDERRAESNQAPAIAPDADTQRKQQIALAAAAARGNRAARQQLQQLEKGRSQQIQAQRTEQRQTLQQAQGQRVGEAGKQQPQREMTRPHIERAQPDLNKAAPARPRIEPRQPRVQPEPRRVAPPQPRVEPRPQPRAPQVQNRPQVVRQPQIVRQPKPPERQLRQEAQPRQQAPRAAPAPQGEARHGPPAPRPAGPPQRQGGKGKGEKP